MTGVVVTDQCQCHWHVSFPTSLEIVFLGFFVHHHQTHAGLVVFVSVHCSYTIPDFKSY